jgi:hypothetical protein
MTPITSNYTIDSILDSFKSELGKNYEAYKNHVYRVYNFSAMQVNSNESLKRLSIAAAFHDIGIWTNHTLDYLDPSAKLAKEYCVKNNLTLLESTEIEVMINNHHKLSKVKISELAEIFRQADLIDLSLGLVSKGRSRNNIKRTRAMLPNRGFHIFLLKLFLKNLLSNPTNPFPIFKL